MGGSPPHLRGKLCILAFRHFKARITPAPAGKTWNSCRFVLAGWDHPRTCGENVRRVSSDFNRRGSPPHLRGKQFGAHPLERQVRITPAPAGKTSIIGNTICFAEDHPRTCGENLSPFCAPCAIRGSPPHLRGKLGLPESSKAPPRITPAPAGKTRLLRLVLHRNRDHPRTCGENRDTIFFYIRLRGSPPHLRGKLKKRF